jgi:hypothetical protein
MTLPEACFFTAIILGTLCVLIAYTTTTLGKNYDREFER